MDKLELSPPSKNFKIIDHTFLFFRKFVIGTGSFGKVLYGMKSDLTEEYAVKFEKSTVKNSVIEEEIKILEDLKGGLGVPKVYWYGKYGEYKVMVMDLLGPSLDKFYKICHKHLNIETTLNFGIEMINRIEYVHSKGYLHRDIKPNNFLLGKFNRNLVDIDNNVYIVDFGLSKTYLDPMTNKHYQFKDSCRFVGTPRYASLNTHIGFRQSRRDDLESIVYILIYFLRGELPWQGIKAKTKSEKKEKIKNQKKIVSSDEMCLDLPKEFVILLDYVKNLNFDETPDYEGMRSILREIKHQYKLVDISNVEWEWNTMFLKSQKYFSTDHKFFTQCKKHYEKLYEGYPFPNFEEYLITLENKSLNSNMNTTVELEEDTQTNKSIEDGTTGVGLIDKENERRNKLEFMKKNLMLKSNK